MNTNKHLIKLDMQSTLLLRNKAITNLKNKYPKNWKNEFYKLVKLYENDTVGNPIEMYRKIYNDTVKLIPQN